jgi:uncharacterized protein involved in outer membrane biogenesis
VVKKVLIVLFAFLAAVLTVALVAPSFIDWNKYKPEIAAEIKSRTGRDLIIEGDIDFAVLPTPTLSVNELRLANLEGAASPDMVSLQALRVRVAMMPLLEGTIQFENVALVEPVIELEVLPDGRRNWEFGVVAEAPERIAGEPGAAPGPRPAPPKVRLDRFRIENGTLTYLDHAAGSIERIDKLNAEIAAQTLAGPFRAEGELTARGLPVEFYVALGTIAQRQPVSVTTRFAFPSAAAKALLSGSLSEPSAQGALSGRLEVEGDDLGRFVQAVSRAGSVDGAPPRLPGFVAQKFAGEGGVAASAKGLEVNDVAFQLGDTRATGAVNVGFGPPLEADIALSANSIDLDRWLAMEAPAGEEGGGSERGAGPESAPAPAGGAGEDAFALPQDVKATLDVSVGALVYKGNVIRQGKLSAALEEGRLTVNQVTALLPGGSDISLSGTVVAKDGKPVADGNVEAVSDNLRGVFDWLGVDASAVPPDRLRRFSFTGKVKSTPAQVDLTNIDLRLDASRLTGGVAIALRERPAFGARLDVDRFNLDAYLPPAKTETAPEKAPARGPASLSRPKEGPLFPALAVLDAFDANVDARVGSLTVRNMQVQGLRFDGTVQKGKLTIRDAGVGDFSGAAMKLGGTASGFAGVPVIDAAFDLETGDLPRLLRAAEVEPLALSERVGRFALGAKAKGPLDHLEVKVGVEGAGGRIDVKGLADSREKTARFDLAVTAVHPDLVQLVRLLKADYRPAAESLGGFSLTARVAGDATAAQVMGLTGKVGPVNVAGELSARLDGPRPWLTGELSTSEIIVDLFLPPRPAGAGPRAAAGKPPAEKGVFNIEPAAGPRWSKEPLDLSGLNAVDGDVRLAAPAISYDKYRVVKPEAELALEAGTLEVRQLTGTMFQGAFDLKGRLAAAEPPTLAGTVMIANANIHEAVFVAGDVDVVEGRLNFDMEVTGAGRSPFEIVSALGGKGRFDAADGVVRGFDLAAVSERLEHLASAESYLAFLATTMKGGETRFTKLDGTFTIEKGVVQSDDLHLLAEAGEGKGIGFVDLPRWFIDLQGEFLLTDHPKAPPVGMHIIGPLDAPQRTIETDRMQAFLLQRGVGTLLRKVLPKEEPAAPGATAPEATAPEAETQPGIESLLKGLLPKKQAPSEPAPAPTEPATAQPAPAPAAPVLPPEEPVPPPKTQPKEPEDVIKEILKGLPF